jgi:hypothetical protein
MLSAMLLAAALAAVPPILTQPHPLVGAWKVNFVGGMRIENGTPTPMKLTGTLTVEAQGDSLIATLVADPNNGASRPPTRLAAKSVSGDVTFVNRSQVTLNVNGAEQRATSVATWKLGVENDKLEGTVDRTLEGVNGPAIGPQPVTGTRVKS